MLACGLCGLLHRGWTSKANSGPAHRNAQSRGPANQIACCVFRQAGSSEELKCEVNMVANCFGCMGYTSSSLWEGKRHPNAVM